jgi:hypothetical protein
METNQTDQTDQTGQAGQTNQTVQALKTIIVVRGASVIGKTPAIRLVYEALTHAQSYTTLVNQAVSGNASTLPIVHAYDALLNQIPQCTHANLGANVPNPVIDPHTGDVHAVLEAGQGKRIGIHSMGDPSTGLYQELLTLAQANCDVILTACRTRGNTVGDVINAARNGGGYEIIWTLHYHRQGGNEVMPNGLNLNLHFVPAMASLIQKL